MITVVGMWEPGYTAEQTFFEDTVWKQVLAAYGVDRFIMVGPPDVQIPGITNPEQFETMEDALATCVGQRIFLTFSDTGAVLLGSFTHPTDAVYIFGCPADNLETYIQSGDHRVHIQTPNPVDFLACSCVNAVLYDRSLP